MMATQLFLNDFSKRPKAGWWGGRLRLMRGLNAAVRADCGGLANPLSLRAWMTPSATPFSYTQLAARIRKHSTGPTTASHQRVASWRYPHARRRIADSECS